MGLAAALALAGCRNERKGCGAPLPPLLEGDGVGALRIGASVEEIERSCLVLADTTLALGNEGMPERRLTAVVGSVATTATVSAGRIWRIEVATPRFRTADSLGVGSHMRDLRSTTARVSAGENGAYVMRSDHCGLSFQLPGVVARTDMRAEDIPDTATVGMVLVVGCGRTDRLDRNTP